MFTPYVVLIGKNRKGIPFSTRAIVLREGTGKFGPYLRVRLEDGREEFISASTVAARTPALPEEQAIIDGLSQNQHVTLPASVERVTERGILLRVRGAKLWAPKSLVQIVSETQVTVPSWWAHKNNLTLAPKMKEALTASAEIIREEIARTPDQDRNAALAAALTLLLENNQ